MKYRPDITVSTIPLPARRLLVKRGANAADYFAYCEELGCGVWDELLAYPGRDGEPLCLWLPDNLRKPGTSAYVQGLVLGKDMTGPAPEGFDPIGLPAATYLRFQGPPFEDKDFESAIGAVRDFMAAYDPAVAGFQWDDSQPRIQLEPRGERGYVELRAVKALR